MNTASQFPHACTTSGQAGWERNVTNQVQFKDGSPYVHSGLTVTDNRSIGRNDLNISYQDIGSYQTTGDGSFPDSHYDCSFYCPSSSGETDALQNFTVSGLPLPHVDLIIYKGSSITIDGR
jgi:hypothetical protein